MVLNVYIYHGFLYKVESFISSTHTLYRLNYSFNYIMLLSFRDWPSFIAADELPPIPIVRSETGPVTYNF